MGFPFGMERTEQIALIRQADCRFDSTHVPSVNALRELKAAKSQPLLALSCV
jgi:hypothetical protein